MDVDSRRNRKVMFVLTALMILSLAQMAPAYADGWGRYDRHDRRDHHDRHGNRWDSRHSHDHYGRSVFSLPRHSITIAFGDGRFHFSEGRFYRRRVHDYVIVAPPVGVVIYSLPGGCQRKMIRGRSYYHYEGVYYRPVSGGYQVVDVPADIETESVPAVSNIGSARAQDTFTVNIPNAQSGYTSVTLKRSGQGYVGPQGEYYSEFPKVEQLRLMYAK